MKVSNLFSSKCPKNTTKTIFKAKRMQKSGLCLKIPELTYRQNLFLIDLLGLGGRLSGTELVVAVKSSSLWVEDSEDFLLRWDVESRRALGFSTDFRLKQNCKIYHYQPDVSHDWPKRQIRSMLTILYTYPLFITWRYQKSFILYRCKAGGFVLGDSGRFSVSVGDASEGVSDFFFNSFFILFW